MTKTAICLIAVLAAAAVPIVGQSAPGDTLSALLSEVRQLRVAMERAATTMPQIQLLAARLTIQNERLARITGDHDSTRRELEELSGANVELTARLQNVEVRRRQNVPPNEQRKLEEHEVQLKEELSARSAHELRLRGRESELAAILSAEQQQWFELNRRLDELERALSLR